MFDTIKMSEKFQVYLQIGHSWRFDDVSNLN